MRSKFYVIATHKDTYGNRTLAVHNYIFGASAIEGEAKVIWHNTNEDRGKMWDNFQRQWGDHYALSYAEAVECMKHCQADHMQNVQLLEVDTTYSFN